MSDLAKVNILTDVKDVNDPRHLDIHEGLRNKLEQGNAFEYWEKVTVTTPSSANTEFTVTCTSLNRIPTDYHQGKSDKAVRIYTGTTTWTKNNLYLKADVSSATVTILVVG